MSALFAFLHHVAAFTLVTALAIELVLIRDAITLSSARRILAADAICGVCAGALLVIGFLRVAYFEKGAGYYFHSVPFIIKMSLFALIGLTSIYPTREFLSWRKLLRQNLVPLVGADKLRRIQRLIHFELTGALLILLCAALMARGVGYTG